jgi:hypothetical protein
MIPSSWTYKDVAELIARLRSEADRAARRGQKEVVAHRERNIARLIAEAAKRFG